jgi:hypothetical protein
MRALPRRSALLAALAALALPATASADDAGSVSASGGPVQATLSWQAADFGVKDPRLAVVRAGATLFEGPPVSSADLCSVGCIFAGTGADAPLKVVDLDGDGEPEVLVDTFTGGAHCCVISDVLKFTGAAYARFELNWGSAGYRLRDVNGDGRQELDGFDPAFEDAFTSHAASFQPPLVLAFDATRKGGFRDLTRRVPAVVRRNLKQALHIIGVARRQQGETEGAVAAYVADLYLLNRAREVRPYLSRARKRGDVPRGFDRRLLAFLHKQGYR